MKKSTTTFSKASSSIENPDYLGTAVNWTKSVLDGKLKWNRGSTSNYESVSESSRYRMTSQFLEEIRGCLGEIQAEGMIGANSGTWFREKLELNKIVAISMMNKTFNRIKEQLPESLKQSIGISLFEDENEWKHKNKVAALYDLLVQRVIQYQLQNTTQLTQRVLGVARQTTTTQERFLKPFGTLQAMYNEHVNANRILGSSCLDDTVFWETTFTLLYNFRCSHLQAAFNKDCSDTYARMFEKSNDAGEITGLSSSGVPPETWGKSFPDTIAMYEQKIRLNYPHVLSISDVMNSREPQHAEGSINVLNQNYRNGSRGGVGRSRGRPHRSESYDNRSQCSHGSRSSGQSYGNRSQNSFGSRSGGHRRQQQQSGPCFLCGGNGHIALHHTLTDDGLQQYRAFKWRNIRPTSPQCITCQGHGHEDCPNNHMTSNDGSDNNNSNNNNSGSDNNNSNNNNSNGGRMNNNFNYSRGGRGGFHPRGRGRGNRYYNPRGRGSGYFGRNQSPNFGRNNRN
jgi:hypothetical protein